MRQLEAAVLHFTMRRLRDGVLVSNDRVTFRQMVTVERITRRLVNLVVAGQPTSRNVLLL